MSKNDLTFGQYIKKKREGLGKSLRSVAADIGMSPAYLSDIEKGNRWPPVKYLEGMIKVLHIQKDELNTFYDLAGDIRDGSYPDLTDYIEKTDIARVALRTARDHNIPDDKWQAFIDDINTQSPKEKK